MKRKKKIATIIWGFVAIILVGIYKIAQYQIAMYYSNIAPEQLENDSAYSQMQFEPTANKIALYGFLILFALVVLRIARNLYLLQKQST